MDDADRVLGTLVVIGRDVTAADTNADGHIELTAIGDSSDDVLGIDQRELGGNIEIGAGHHAGALDGHMRDGFLDIAVESGEDKTLHVQNDVGDVLDNALGGGELVLHALDLDSGCLSTVQRREQDATQRVAKRVAIAALERLDDEASNGVAYFLCCNCRPHELCHALQASLSGSAITSSKVRR